MTPPKHISAAILPIKLTNRNDGQGHHWGRTVKSKNDLLLILDRFKASEPFSKKVRLVVTRILGKGERLWDADSVGRGNAKQLIDCLVQLGWFVDDSPKYIRPVDFRQDDTDRANGPCVRIEVYEAE